jgi:hypothetical protein
VRKSRAGVTAVAEGLVGRLSAAAETNRGASGKAKSVTGWIDNFEIALDAQGTIAVAGDLRGWHEERVTGKWVKSKKGRVQGLFQRVRLA